MVTARCQKVKGALVQRDQLARGVARHALRKGRSDDRCQCGEGRDRIGAAVAEIIAGERQALQPLRLISQAEFRIPALFAAQQGVAAGSERDQSRFAAHIIKDERIGGEDHRIAQLRRSGSSFFRHIACQQGDASNGRPCQTIAIAGEPAEIRKIANATIHIDGNIPNHSRNSTPAAGQWNIKINPAIQIVPANGAVGQNARSRRCADNIAGVKTRRQVHRRRACRKGNEWASGRQHGASNCQARFCVIPARRAGSVLIRQGACCGALGTGICRPIKLGKPPIQR